LGFRKVELHFFTSLVTLETIHEVIGVLSLGKPALTRTL